MNFWSSLPSSSGRSKQKIHIAGCSDSVAKLGGQAASSHWGSNCTCRRPCTPYRPHIDALVWFMDNNPLLEGELSSLYQPWVWLRTACQSSISSSGCRQKLFLENERGILATRWGWCFVTLHRDDNARVKCSPTKGIEIQQKIVL